MLASFRRRIADCFVEVADSLRHTIAILDDIRLAFCTILQVANLLIYRVNLLVYRIDLRIDVIDGINHCGTCSKFGNIAYITGLCHIRDRDIANRLAILVDHIKGHALRIFTGCILHRRDRIRACFDMRIRIICGCLSSLNGFLQLCHVDRIRCFRTGSNARDLAGHRTVFFTNRNSCIRCLPGC